jgi:molecular chaperone HscA
MYDFYFKSSDRIRFICLRIILNDVIFSTLLVPLRCSLQEKCSENGMTKISINIKEASLEERELIAGIDLGTTNSLIAFVNSETGIAETVKEQGKSSLVPSIVHFAKDGSVIVGVEAKTYLVNNPQNTIYSVKRLMGKSYKDVSGYEGYFGYKIIDEDKEQLVKIRVGNKFYTPIELSSFILKALKERAERVMNYRNS